MRRNSLLILMSMIVLLVVMGVLLFSIFLQSSTSDPGVTGTVTLTTPLASLDQQITLSSEPVGIPMRLVYIVSILVVFVSAVLILSRILLGISGKNEE
jgi:hypothetical protein